MLTIEERSRHSRKTELGTDQTRASRCKFLDLDDSEGLSFLPYLACHPTAPTVILLVLLELQNNYCPLRNLLKELWVIKEILIKLLDQESMLLLKLPVH